MRLYDYVQGAVDIEVDTGGVEMDGPVYDRRFTYLDSSGMGRPVIELKKTNVVNEHNSKLVSILTSSMFNMIYSRIV